jgi:hypothetical protein
MNIWSEVYKLAAQPELKFQSRTLLQTKTDLQDTKMWWRRKVWEGRYRCFGEEPCENVISGHCVQGLMREADGNRKGMEKRELRTGGVRISCHEDRLRNVEERSCFVPSLCPSLSDFSTVTTKTPRSNSSHQWSLNQQIMPKANKTPYRATKYLFMRLLHQ